MAVTAVPVVEAVVAAAAAEEEVVVAAAASTAVEGETGTGRRSVLTTVSLWRTSPAAAAGKTSRITCGKRAR